MYEAQGAIEAGKKLPLVDVGAAFYPNMVLLNHSCCPNTIRINQGKKVFGKLNMKTKGLTEHALDLPGGQACDKEGPGGD